MITETQQKCVMAYRKHKHLGLAGEEIGMPWQTVYWHLKKCGEPVTGDKKKHGSTKDRFAARAEEMFHRIVPEAIDQNDLKYQAKFDFLLHGIKIEIKASSLRSKPNGGWCFSLKKQTHEADFFVCFGYDKEKEISHCFIFPSEIVSGMSSLRVGFHAHEGAVGKWSCYEVDINHLANFFSHAEAA